jgi:hypothetical protein
MRLDSLYNFRYEDPKTKPHVWDRNPVVFILDITKKSMLGVNIHWIPKDYRADFIDEIASIITKSKSKHEKARLTYMLLKKPKYKRALLGIRRYIISRMKGVTEIPKKKWDKVLEKKRWKPDIKGLKKLMKMAVDNGERNEWRKE